ncbi:MAG TPA: DUF2256 domain-containing protein, partial [Oceanospirillales bacterium]|nr:DUF2256 domain-containing protein [Oceanospirillales bacterium]
EKNCAYCQRPFCWRRKWARDWENVRYCSQRCKRAAKSTPAANLCASASVEDEF